MPAALKWEDIWMWKIHHLGFKQWSCSEEKHEAHWAHAKLYLLQMHHAVRWWHAFLPLSTSHFLSVSRIPDPGNYLLLLCKPWLSLLLPRGLFFEQSFWCVSASWLRLSDQCTQAVTVQIPAAFTGAGHSPAQLVLLGWDFPRAPAAEQVTDRLRHVWWLSHVCHKGGWKTETLYGNLLTLKTAWLLAKSEKFQHNFSKPPVQPFIIYLSTAVRGIFLSVTLVHHLP